MSRLLMSVCVGLMLTIGTSTLHASGQLNVVVILDNSGSMKGMMNRSESKIDAAKSALMQVLDKSPATSQVGVLLLNPGPQGDWLIPLGPIDRANLQRSVASLDADGNTPLGAKMKVAADALLQLREANRYGTYKMLIVSDGEASDPDLVQQYLPSIQARGILIDVIGVNMAQKHSLATQTSTYRNANDPNSLAKAIGDVVLGESSASPDDAAGQTDFEVLAALPDQVAMASLAALTAASNDPIEKSQDWVPDESSTSSHGSSAPANSGHRSPPPPKDKSPISMFQILVFIFIFAAIARAVFANLKSKR